MAVRSAFAFGVEIVLIATTSAIFEWYTLIGALIVVIACDILLTTSVNWWQAAGVLYITATILAFLCGAEIVLVSATSAIGEHVAKSFVLVIIKAWFNGTTITSFGWQEAMVAMEWFWLMWLLRVRLLRSLGFWCWWWCLCNRLLLAARQTRLLVNEVVVVAGTSAIVELPTT